MTLLREILANVSVRVCVLPVAMDVEHNSFALVRRRHRVMVRLKFDRISELFHGQGDWIRVREIRTVFITHECGQIGGRTSVVTHYSF